MADWLQQCRQRVLLMDGAMGTNLHARGLPPGECPEKWAREHPTVLSGIHQEFADAGSDALLTCTFGGSPLKLAAAGLDGETEALNWALARVAREVAGSAIVLGDIGPCGEMLEPLGSRTRDEVRDGFGRQVVGLDAVVDGFIIETMTDLNEALLALEAAKKISPEKPVLASLNYEKDADGQGYHTIMGVDPATAARELQDAGADAVGANCGTGIEDMIGIVEQLASAAEVPVFAEPNAGMPKLRQGRTVFEQSPEDMAARLGELVSAGARLVGGCCGTTAEHIQAMRAVLDGMQPRS